MKPLVFCIGLNKTGTHSLSAALRILGWTPQHDEHKNNALLENLDFGTKRVNAYLDGNLPFHFRELHRKFPGAKFILTERELRSWLRSREGHVKRNRNKKNYKGNWLKVDFKKWVRIYNSHYPAVADFFQDKPLLRMNIIEGDGWDKLCDFFSLPIPDVPFPKLYVKGGVA